MVPNPSSLLVKENIPISDAYTSNEESLMVLNTKYALAVKQYPKPYMVNRHLIYYTVSHDEKYIRLLEISIRSLVNKLTMNDLNHSKYEILIMCPREYDDLITAVLPTSPVLIHMHYIDDAKDGVEASMNKLRVYEWEGIVNYQKILYMDTDVVFNQQLADPVNELFNMALNDGVLYASIHRAAPHLHKLMYHKIIDYSEDVYNGMVKKGIFAFNAGLYLFNNTPVMRAHFDNIIWLSKHWKGEYFFEQAYMNHYFNTNFISDVHLLMDKVQFMAIHMGANARIPFNSPINEEPLLIHFSGHACNAEEKLKYIQTYYPQYIDN